VCSGSTINGDDGCSEPEIDVGFSAKLDVQGSGVEERGLENGSSNGLSSRALRDDASRSSKSSMAFMRARPPAPTKRVARHVEASCQKGKSIFCENETRSVSG
jgi:hypothetical protein